MTNQLVYVTIGNSDDNLSQRAWAAYWADVDQVVVMMAAEVHFVGAALPCTEYQNACWSFEIPGRDLDLLTRHLSILAGRYKQHSIAVAIARVSFVGPPKPVLEPIADAVQAIMDKEHIRRPLMLHVDDPCTMLNCGTGGAIRMWHEWLGDPKLGYRIINSFGHPIESWAQHRMPYCVFVGLVNLCEWRNWDSATYGVPLGKTNPQYVVHSLDIPEEHHIFSVVIDANGSGLECDYQITRIDNDRLNFESEDNLTGCRLVIARGDSNG